MLKIVVFLQQTQKNTPTKNLKNIAKNNILKNYDVLDFLTKSNIIKESEIGGKDLAVFILNKSPKALSDLISTTWKMNAAPETTAREDCNLDVYHPQSCCWGVCNQNKYYKTTKHTCFFSLAPCKIPS